MFITWSDDGQPVTFVSARPAEDSLECPRCARKKPYETTRGTLRCWWCDHEGGWHEFPRVAGKGDA